MKDLKSVIYHTDSHFDTTDVIICIYDSARKGEHFQIFSFQIKHPEKNNTEK